MTDILRQIVGDADCSDDLLNFYIQAAEDYILSYCRRTDIPRALEMTQLRIAAIFYNNPMGAQSETEGKTSTVFQMMGHDIPASITSALNTYRKVRVIRAST